MIKSKLAVVALTFIVTACSMVDPMTSATELENISVVAVNNDIKIKPSDTFSWNKDIIIIGAENTKKNNIATALTSTIEKVIKDNGHTFTTDDTHNSDFNLTAMLILDKPGDNNAAMHFGLDPSIGHSAMHHAKGSLILAVKDNKTILLWRGAVQIFTKKNVKRDVRDLRSKHAIASLLKELFSKKIAAPAT